MARTIRYPTNCIACKRSFQRGEAFLHRKQGKWLCHCFECYRHKHDLPQKSNEPSRKVTIVASPYWLDVRDKVAALYLTAESNLIGFCFHEKAGRSKWDSSKNLRLAWLNKDNQLLTATVSHQNNQHGKINVHTGVFWLLPKQEVKDELAL